MTITCPYCGFTSDECDFPDLFYPDSNNTAELNKQLELLEEIQKLGFNVVTCGDCGQVFIQEI